MKIRNWKDVPVTEPMTGLTKRVAIGPEILGNMRSMSWKDAAQP